MSEVFSFRRKAGSDRDIILGQLENRLGISGTELLDTSLWALLSLVLHFEGRDFEPSLEDGKALADGDLIAKVKIDKSLDAALEYLRRNGFAKPIRWGRNEIFEDLKSSLLRVLLKSLGVEMLDWDE